MKNIFQISLRLLILICVIAGSLVIYQSYEDSRKKQSETRNVKAIALQRYLSGYNKPSRIEIFSYTKRFGSDVEEIKKAAFPVDENSTFYVTIQFFTDENDPDAPLVAQVRFMDLKTDNMVKEESINL